MKPTFNLLDQQFMALSIRWDLQRELFRTDDAEARESFHWGSHAWHYLNRGLVDSMFIIIGRLMDPPKTGKKDNLSLDYMVGKLPCDQRRDEVEAMVAGARATYDSKIKPWRHWVLAHTDLETARNPLVLPNMPFQEFDELVSGLLGIARKLSLIVRDCDCDFRGDTPAKGWRIWHSRFDEEGSNSAETRD